MNDQPLTREELLEALAKSQTQVNILQKALLEGSSQVTESRYQEIVEGQTDMVSRWLPDTTLTYANQAYFEYFGQPAEEMLGKRFLPNLPDEAQRIVQESVRKLTSREVVTLVTEERSIDADGNPRWIQWTYGVIWDENGELYEMQSVGRDFTELQETRIALEQANIVVEQSPVVLFRRKIENNLSSEIVFVTDNVKQYGYAATDILSGKIPFDSLFHPDDLPVLGKDLVHNITHHVDTFQNEYRMLRRDRVTLWVTLQLTIERDEHGEAIFSQGTMVDNTARKMAELALAERAKSLATVAEVSTAVATLRDPQEMLQQVVDLTKERFDLYHAHLYLLNETGDTLELVSGAGNVGRQMVTEKRIIPMAAEQSLVARAARSREAVIANDVRSDPDFLAHPLLPETRAELSVPLIAGNTVLGVLDVQADEAWRFTDEDSYVLTTLASQVAVALQNAQHVADREELLKEARSRAEQEALINAISQKIQATTTVENALQVAIRELGNSLGAKQTSIRLGVDADQRKRKI
ncbi:MAG: PAS domain-containing protein [Anaerolineaceae bacterium]|nr:PAS domain-containing protein [Anaerolineaceae bacterium]